MSESLEAVLIGATQTALETTAFLFAEPFAPRAEEAAPAAEPFVATVRFSGAHHGAFSIEFPARLLPVLATNVLGEDEAPGDELQRDALGELANIICGNVLPALDPAGKYSLGPPAVSVAAAVVSGDAARVAMGELQVDGERVSMSLWICAPASAARCA
jgi:CheY-specific phosphatase CheX